MLTEFPVVHARAIHLVRHLELKQLVTYRAL